MNYGLELLFTLTACVCGGVRGCVYMFACMASREPVSSFHPVVPYRQARQQAPLPSSLVLTRTSSTPCFAEEE